MSAESSKSSDLIPDDSGAVPVAGQDPKSRRSLSRVKIELSDEELASTGVQKMLVEELGRCQETIASLESYRSKYHESDKKLAIEVEKNKKHLGIEMISTGCLAVGAAAFGYAPSLTSLPLAGYIAVIFGLVLTVIGVCAKAILLK